MDNAWPRKKKQSKYYKALNFYLEGVCGCEWLGREGLYNST